MSFEISTLVKAPKSIPFFFLHLSLEPKNVKCTLLFSGNSVCSVYLYSLYEIYRLDNGLGFRTVNRVILNQLNHAKWIAV